MENSRLKKLRDLFNEAIWMLYECPEWHAEDINDLSKRFNDVYSNMIEEEVA